MSEEIKDTSQQQPTQPTETGDQSSGKMFTQEDVNRIVSERLAQDRKKRSGQQQDEEKEMALKARESRLDCREYLSDKKYPVELLDVLDTSDFEKFKEAADKLEEIYSKASKQPRFVNPPKFTGPKGMNNPQVPDPIRDAFKPQA